MDCGEDVSAWLSKFLGKPCRLIRQSSDFLREMKNGRAKGKNCPDSLTVCHQAFT